MEKDKTLPVDIFLYSCLEYERTLSSPDRPISWPQLGSADRMYYKNHDIDQLLDQLFEWYLEKYPILASEEGRDPDSMSEVAPIVVSLIKDLTLLYKQKTGKQPPPLSDDDKAPVPAFWIEVKLSFEKNFHDNAELYYQYIHWSFKNIKTDDVVDGNSRPPVGRFAPSRQDRPLRPSLSSRDHNENRYNNNRHSDNNYRSNSSSNGQYRNNGNNHRHRNDEGQHKRNNDSRRGYNKDRRPPRFRKEGEDKEKKEAALKDCHNAFEKLNSNSEIKKVILDAQNSYYRRLQHNCASENGFFSESVGEGSARSVVISRQPQK